MEKDDLKSLVTQMYQNLLENIDSQTNASKEQVVEYLRNAIDVVSNISDDKIDSIEHAKSAFDDAYKEIAKKSISSYKYSNEKFEQLTQMHEETLTECSDNMINIPEITKKFNDIQDHMMDEVGKANDIITKLTSQVKTLEKESNLDALTKVFNRRALSTHLTNICTPKTIPYELHLLILDIDDFKKINDTYGHIAGDKILIFIAHILKKTLRDGDKIFRYGGEEFILVLNRIDAIHCQKIAQRILKLISQNKLIYKGESLNVTVSIGTTVLTGGDSPDTLIARADKALYQAKADGKNRVCTEAINGN
ncbi:GGDEF domain-containing protein [Sulfurimonas sp. SAG-AH-194-I05]|nr:GGDEF domain-containing protein [Sulfurimonas sp. SAG-AH-194-I05]MDF1874818.1 GGDEF domain-containing protein [Sulfurimonas sp. SAG-AH-194-I05]